MNTHDLLHAYYDACVHADAARIRDLVSPGFTFRSPQDRTTGFEEFAERCMPYMRGLAGVRYLREVIQGDEAFVVLEWTAEGGGTFVDAELVRCAGGRVEEVIVVNNDPAFCKRLFESSESP